MSKKVGDIPHFIYALRASPTSQVRYIGVTCDPCKRSGVHRKFPPCASNHQLRRWVARLHRNGKEPVFDVIGSFRGKHSERLAYYIESCLIAYYAEKTHGRLLNLRLNSKRRDRVFKGKMRTYRHATNQKSLF